MFQKGKSGNPGGRKGIPKSLSDKLAKVMPAAFDEIIDLMKNSDDDNVRLKAANILIERHFGKPVQPIGNENDGKPLLIKWEE